MADLLVVASKVKAKIKQTNDLRTSAEYIEMLSKHVEQLIEQATTRAIAAKRKTVTAADFTS